MRYPYLSNINQPSDLRPYTESTLIEIARELRDFLINTLDVCGGHFGANLGAVELTLALHAVFDTPEDKLIWDVGHQAYPHKILTGRREALSTIRQTGGLAPFPARTESIYDDFTVGHSSTSISAALGMAIAAKAKGLMHDCIAVIGDGGLTGGMAFEALNHAGALDANILVILNDNKMSISHNVGALTHYLARILSSKTYTHLRESSKKVLSKMPSMKAWVKKTETHVKGMITPGTLFEELGFHYFGPIDGHDLSILLPTLKNLRELKGPRLLHVVTEKGKGYAPAEEDPIKYHAVKAGFKQEEVTAQETVQKKTYSDVFGAWLCEMAAQDTRLMAITPAMCEGSGMVDFANNYPARYFDVGIAEQHSLTLAAGMACEALKPVVAIYSTFLQRAYDQCIHDIALQNLDVTLAIDRAGLVGGDGATHNGSFDLSYLRCIPNMIVMAPAHAEECRQMLYTAYNYSGPAAVRYPRGEAPQIKEVKPLTDIPIGQAELLHEGKKIAILAFGSRVLPSLEVAKDLGVTLVNMRFIKPLDENMLEKMVASHTQLVTVEENVVSGGAGSAVNEWLARRGCLIQTLNLGLPDEFVAHGNPEVLLAQYGLDVAGIKAAIYKSLQ